MQKLADSLFVDDSKNYDLILKEWNRIAADATFLHKVKACDAPWPVPTWSGNLNEKVSVLSVPLKYRVLAVDGSQIYPDRHQSISCYLINIGTVSITYGGSSKPVEFSSIPRIFTAAMEENMALSPDFVNCRRQELELIAGVEFSHNMKPADDIPSVLLFDGSFIFWHLEAKEIGLRDLFLPRYLASLHQLYLQQILTASYISLPKSRELVNLLRLSFCNFDFSQSPVADDMTNGFIDATIAHLILKPGERTILFKNNAAISKHYLDHVRPYFFYIHVGDEIGRVEIPAYIAECEDKVSLIASIVLDQAKKGRGYPVALAESHEQAVVKGVDRDFFTQLLYKIGIERKYMFAQSIKMQRKKNIGI